MRMRVALLAALACLSLARPALADISYTAGSGTTIFDFTCFTTKHCTAQVLINSAGTEIFTSANPAQVTGANGSFPVTGTITANAGSGTFTVSGSVTANAGTNLNTSLLALDTSINGILISQGTALGSSKGPMLQGSVTTAAPTYTTGQISPFSLTTAGALRTDSSAVTQPVSGTVTANAGTNLNTSALALDTSVNGLLLSLGSTTSGQKGTLALGAVTTSNPSYTTAQSNALSLDAAGGLRVNCIVGCSSSGGSSLTDQGTFTQATTAFTVMGGEYNTSITTLTSGQGGAAQMTNDRMLFVNIGKIGGTAPDTNSGNKSAGTQRMVIATDQPALTNAQPGNFSQIAGTTVDVNTGAPSAGSQRVVLGSSTAYFVQPGASDNHANIKNGAGVVYGVVATNNSATVNYLRLYNAATGFNGCNSATNLITQVAIPASTSVGGVVIPFPAPIAFSTGISICVSSGYATTDTTAATASAMSTTILYN